MKTPFSLVYEKMESDLRADRGLGQYLKPGNIILWTETVAPVKDAPGTADLPELMLRPSLLAPQLGSASCGSRVNMVFGFQLNTGEQKLSAAYFPISWILLGILHRWKFSQVLDGLLWQDKTFVVDTNILDVAAGLSSASDNRNIEGWSALWNFEVQMSFNEFNYGI